MVVNTHAVIWNLFKFGHPTFNYFKKESKYMYNEFKIYRRNVFLIINLLTLNYH